MTTAVSLADRYTQRDGRILITGVQALVRLMLAQAERDRAAGLNTGGFVRGYRGSRVAGRRSRSPRGFRSTFAVMAM